MEYKDIVRNIKEGSFKKVYLFYGREFYLLENITKVFKESLNESMLDFNLSALDGREIMLDQLISSIETLPFMDDRKIVLVKDFELLRGKRKNFSEEDEKNLTDYIHNIPDTSTLVFIVYGDVDKRKGLVKKISKEGIVFNCDKLNDIELFKWVKNKFKKKEVVISDSEVMYFIEKEDYRSKNSDKTLSDLENEINKIVSFTGKEKVVTKDTIDKLSQRKVENDIFKLIDAIGSKNSSYALKILDDMILEGESVLGIFAMISRQFKIVMQSTYLQNKGYSSKLIAEKINVHPFAVTKALKQSNNFSDDTILSLLNDILESDYKIKNGLMKDTLAIEIIVSKYCA
jgi:DNA polymerase III subunit delta